jgi:hypothetical protein
MKHFNLKPGFKFFSILFSALLFFGLSVGQGFAEEPINQRQKDAKYQQWKQLRTEAVLALSHNKYTKSRVAIEKALEVAQTHFSTDYKIQIRSIHLLAAYHRAVYN